MFKFIDKYNNKKAHKKERKKQYKRKYLMNNTKYIRFNPSNGQTVDCVDMMFRNKERFNYGLKLNEE